MTPPLWQFGAAETADLIRAGHVSAREVTQAHLQRLEAVNPRLNAVVHQFPEAALADADAAYRHQRSGGVLGPLHGVPVTIKITADQQGQPADNGVVLFKDLLAPEDAPAVSNLKQAGAIIIGRTNSPAFAMRFVTDNVLHGQTWNPWSREVTSGGSSGGAGAATAAGIGALAHGTDIGGSIRWPAYCNGIVGLRTTPGRIPVFSRSAAMATRMAAQLMAVPGPMARSVRDVQLGLEAMAARGHPGDPLWVPAPLRGSSGVRPGRVALVTESPGTEVHASALDAVRRAGHHLEHIGYEVEECAPPGFVRAHELWETLGLHEIRATLEPLLDRLNDARLTASLTDWWSATDSPDLAGYWAALAERHTLMRQWSEFMARYPVIITPVSAMPRVHPDQDVLPGGMRLLVEKLGRYLFQSPVLGLPVLAMPLGQFEGQPQGVQIYGPRFREDLCLEIGAAIEIIEGPRPVIDPRG